MPNELLDLADLRDSWLTELRGQRKSPSTLRAYRLGVDTFLRFCAADGRPAELTKASTIAWLAAMTDKSASSAQLWLRSIKLFAKWLAVEEGFDADPILAVRPPRLDQKVVPHLPDSAVQAILRTCTGTELRDRRDKALVVLFTETGLRAAEMLALDVADVSVADCVLTVRRGKGGKGRRSKFSPQCAAVLDKYLRARRKAGYPASEGRLWVGTHGPLTYSGLKNTLTRRAEAAGVTGFHIHRLRHTAAVRWLRAGGSEGGLMAQSGWQSRTMIDRYVRSASEDLAAGEFDRLDLAVEP